jgi:hypothetical protein
MLRNKDYGDREQLLEVPVGASAEELLFEEQSSHGSDVSE